MNSNATINAKHAACKYSVWIDLSQGAKEGKKEATDRKKDCEG